MYCRRFSRVTTLMFSRMLDVGLPLHNRLLLTVLVCNTACKGANKTISMFRVPKKNTSCMGRRLHKTQGWVLFE